MTPGASSARATLAPVLLIAAGLAAAFLQLAATDLGAPSAARAALLHNVELPRIAVALLAGAGLGLAGALLQEILRNPAASPSTMGVAAGAQLALVLATVFAPGLLAWGREWIAGAGGVAALVLVLLLTARRGWSPASLLLGGLIVALYAGSLSGILTLLHVEEMSGLFIWGGGALTQSDWTGAWFLGPRILIGLVLGYAMHRPLVLVGLDDGVARSAGLSAPAIRAYGLALAVFLTGAVVAAVGVVAFVGLAAPALARLCGARQLKNRLLCAPLHGAGLLLLADRAVVLARHFQADLVPTGVATAALGAPLLLWLLPRIRGPMALSGAAPPALSDGRPRPGGRGVAFLVALLLAATFAALFVAPSPDGLALTGWHDFQELASFRWPRTLAAGAAGAILALAGAILQRLMRNPLASPEILGVSSGAALGLAGLALFAPDAGRLAQTGAAGLGAGAALLAILVLARRHGYGGERVLLTGIALSALLGAAMSALMAGGTPTALQLLSFTMGSTYWVDEGMALASLVALGVLSAFVPPMLRWLLILPLGDPLARGLGVPLGVSRLALLVLASLLTAAGTLVAGPLSFAGLLGPHLARLLGLTRPGQELPGAALAGATIMVAADWTGRVLVFPWQMPTGLTAMLIGMPMLLLLLIRRHASAA